MSNEIKELKKMNSLQSKIINKIINQNLLKKYIEEDDIIFKTVEILKFNNFKMHRGAFKRFMTTSNLDVDNMKDYELESAAMNLYKFNKATTSIVNQKLEELKYLKLIEFNDDNNFIIGTDLLATILNKKYKRVSKSIKNEKQFEMETEDRLFAYRHLENTNYIEENKEFLEKLDIYNNIYIINKNQFVIGRREKETLDGLYHRMKKALKSELVDTKTYEDEDGNFNHIPIRLFFNKKMKAESKDFEEIFKTIPNKIEFIRY